MEYWRWDVCILKVTNSFWRKQIIGRLGSKQKLKMSNDRYSFTSASHFRNWCLSWIIDTKEAHSRFLWVYFHVGKCAFICIICNIITTMQTGWPAFSLATVVQLLQTPEIPTPFPSSALLRGTTSPILFETNRLCTQSDLTLTLFLSSKTKDLQGFPLRAAIFHCRKSWFIIYCCILCVIMLLRAVVSACMRLE